jgi:monoterpene epsilon-lactone hydrolase
MKRWVTSCTTFAVLAVFAGAAPSGALANGPGADLATVTISNAQIPFSSLASEVARAALATQLDVPPQQDAGEDPQSIRAFNGKLDEDRLAIVRSLYKVKVVETTVAGVPAHILTPAGGVSKRNRDRVLINLHNGGFMWGAGPGGVVEAAPIAAVLGVEVIAIDYRMAPEFKFPAASQDVAAVYRELLKTHRPKAIGLFGCSAGGVLAAEAVAWFAVHGLPQPGAIASSCGSGAEFLGDSGYLSPALTGREPVKPGAKPLLLASLAYFQGVSPQDPLAFPVVSQEILAQFPPTLLLAGSRDFAASSLTVMHRRLRAAGVEADLYLFDGLTHAFLLEAEIPESQEAYGVISRFFDTHLDRR